MGLIIVVLAILEATGAAAGIRWVTLTFGFVATGAGVLDLTNVSSRLGEAATSTAVQPAIGVGLYAVVAGGVTVIVGGLLKR
jgi:Na+/glutamate symporter